MPQRPAGRCRFSGVIKTHDDSSYAGMGALHRPSVGWARSMTVRYGGVLYLESATFVTGEILHIDGGQSAGR